MQAATLLNLHFLSPPLILRFLSAGEVASVMPLMTSFVVVGSPGRPDWPGERWMGPAGMGRFSSAAGGQCRGGGGVILFSSRLGVFFSWHGEEVFCFCNLFTVFLIKQIQVGWFGLRTREIFRHKTQGIWKFLLAETSVFTSFLLMLPGLLSWSFSPNGVAVAVQKVAATAVAVVVEVRSSRSGGGGIGSGRGSGGR